MLACGDLSLEFWSPGHVVSDDGLRGFTTAVSLAPYSLPRRTLHKPVPGAFLHQEAGTTKSLRASPKCTLHARLCPAHRLLFGKQ